MDTLVGDIKIFDRCSEGTSYISVVEKHYILIPLSRLNSNENLLNQYP